MRIEISEHAVDRYIERIAAGATRQQARERLLRIAETGKKIKEVSPSGHPQYLGQTEDGEVVIIMRTNKYKHYAQGRTIIEQGRVVTTCLTRHQVFGNDGALEDPWM